MDELGEMYPKMETATVAELPRYRCHKEVRALKILAVAENEQGAMIAPADPAYQPFQVSTEYVRKHNPQPGMYFVIYDDGYQSASPAKAFEEGYVGSATADRKKQLEQTVIDAARSLLDSDAEKPGSFRQLLRAVDALDRFIAPSSCASS